MGLQRVNEMRGGLQTADEKVEPAISVCPHQQPSYRTDFVLPRHLDSPRFAGSNADWFAGVRASYPSAMELPCPILPVNRHYRAWS